MAKKKKSIDVNMTALEILRAATSGPRLTASAKKALSEQEPPKKPPAVAVGRLRGLKGDKARARKLTAKQRINIAKKLAGTRWSK